LCILELKPGAAGEGMTVDGKNYSAQQLLKAIEYQLGERLQFVKPPDPAVASLLFDYAAIDSAVRSMESAKHVLKLAGKYGYPAPKIEALNSEFDRRLWWKGFRFIMLLGAGCLVGVAVLMELRRRGHFVLSRAEL
jgi:hypothetical protein